jgi:hypothetical protein
MSFIDIYPPTPLLASFGQHVSLHHSDLIARLFFDYCHSLFI